MAIIFSSEKEEEGSVGWYWVLFALRINPTFTLILKKLPYQSLHILYARLCLKDGTLFFSELCFSKFSNLQAMPRAFSRPRC